MPLYTKVGPMFLFLFLPSLAIAASPTHFDGCQQPDVMFFAYTKDRQEAVEVCRVSEGYRFTYGPINKPVVQRMRGREEIYRVKEGETRGVEIDEFVIASELKGGTHFYIGETDKYPPKLVKKVELEDRGFGFFNMLYCATTTPLC